MLILKKYLFEFLAQLSSDTKYLLTKCSKFMRNSLRKSFLLTRDCEDAKLCKNCKNISQRLLRKKFHVRGLFLGSVFGRTDFSRIFVFEPPAFVADFVTGFYLLIFWWGKSAQNQNRPKFILQNPRHILAEGPGSTIPLWTCTTCALKRWGLVAPYRRR